MKIKLRYKLVAFAVFLAGIFMWGRHSKLVPHVPLPAHVLPREDKEQILVNPGRHSLIILGPSGSRTLTLPDRESVIDIRKDGTVDITSPQFGWEHRLFFGVQGSNALRFAAGMDAFYFKKLDMGAGIACQVGVHSPLAFIMVSYNVWSNCRVGLTYGTDRLVGGTITVRL